MRQLGLATELQAVPATRREQVTSHLRAEILRGGLGAGTRISEATLAADFGVSRGPIREAVRVLEEEGLLTTKPYVGTFVATISGDELLQAYQLRRLIEPYAFKLIWPMRTDEFREELIKRHKDLATASRGSNWAEEVKAKLEFYSTSYEFSGDPLLLGFWQHLAHRIQLGLQQRRLNKERRERAQGTHCDYLRSALGDDYDDAIRVVDTHIDLGIEDLLAFGSNPTNTHDRHEDAAKLGQPSDS